MTLKKTNVPGFIKDMSTNVIINTNNDEYRRIKETRNRQKRIEQLEEDTAELKNDIKEIKELLLKALNG